MNAADVNSVHTRRRPRILLIGRRFWPHGSHDSAGHLYQLACALQRQGASVEVLTPRYSSSWPAELMIREIPVHRPLTAPKRDWSLGRYSRSLTSWLRQNSASYDVMLCDSIREESSAAVDASRSHGCPVILRSSGWGDNSDSFWWTTSRAARRCGTIGMMADAVIAKSAVCQRELLAEGYPQDRVVRIDPGFAAGPVRNASARERARKRLGAANRDLATEANSTVLICSSRMTANSGVAQLVEAARHLIVRFPNLRFWFLGDGPHREWIYDRLRGSGLRESIAMPGSFCDVEDLLTAADAYFQPDDEGLEFWMPSAIAADLPIVSVDTPSARAVIGGSSRTDDELSGESSSRAAESWIQWCAAGDPLLQGKNLVTPKSISVAIRSTLDDIEGARDRATQLRRFLLRTRPQSESIAAYLRLIENVIHRRSVNRRGASIEART